ncbi:MAG: conditioned medium-induced protein 4 [Halobacteriales archaeon]
MDEKTEELREVFLDVADEETVTERQEDPRGSIAVDDDDIEDRLRSTITRMEDRYDVAPEFSRGELVELVRLFYEGADDAEIARELGGVDADAVSRARLDLHLVTAEDREGPIDFDELRDRLDAGRSLGEITDDIDATESALERWKRVAEVEEERRLVGDRFRLEFERLLGEEALTGRLTEGITEDGLEDATEGIETNVSF